MTVQKTIGILWIAVAFIILVSHARAQEVAHLPQSLLKAVTDIDAAASNAGTALRGIDFAAVKLSPRERKWLEDSVARTVRSIALVKSQAELVRRRESLQAVYALKSVVGGFERQMDNLSFRLARLEILQGTNASPKIEGWLAIVDKVADSIGVASLSFDGEALNVLSRADALITRGTLLR
jgi:hypothetical protein